MKIDDSRFIASFRRPFTKKEGRLFFVDEEKIRLYDKDADSGINYVKRMLKRWPSFYEFVRAVFGPGMSLVRHLTPQAAPLRVFQEDELGDKIMVNLGGGTKRIHPEVVNLDIYPLPRVLVVADVRDLPFKDWSLDMVICESVLEHVPDVERAVSEISRVVKRGGYLYVSVPFMYPFHASPSDYFRWTQEGLKKVFDDFEVIEMGMRAGPMAALQGILMHLFAIPLSFGSSRIYLFWAILFMIVLSPLKVFDAFFSFFPQSHEIGADIYFLGRKK